MAYVPNKSDPDYVRGLDIVKRYYEEAKKIYPKYVTYSFDEMLTSLQSRKGQQAFLEGLGLGINASGFSNSQVQSAMHRLAVKSSGKIPSRNQDFRDFLINEGTKVDFVDMVTYVAKESAKDIISGAQAVGDSLILTGKLFTFAFPFIVGVLVYFWVKKQK